MKVVDLGSAPTLDTTLRDDFGFFHKSNDLKYGTSESQAQEC